METAWPDVAGPVRRFLRRVVGADRAEDLASDTMLALLEYAGGRRVRRPVSFALRVAWNKAVDLLRKRGGRETTADPEVLASIPAPDPARIAELREWLDSGLARLSAEDRALLHLRYDEGLDYRDLARALGVPTGTVGRRLHDARRRLASVLRASDEGRGLPIVLLSFRSWWVIAMSKKLALAAVLVLAGAGGLMWWLLGSRESAPALAPAVAGSREPT
jgi:RNA polymerase sigma-70 factor, ECF subfamily